MATITIPKNITGQRELVIIPKKEFEQMQSRMFPIVYLKGRAAKKLDRRVEKGLSDFRKGKTRILHSLADLR